MDAAGERLNVAWRKLYQEQSISPEEYALVVQEVANAEWQRARRAWRRVFWDKVMGLVCAAVVIAGMIVILARN